MEVLSSFMGRSGFLPHGYCFTWSPTLLWSMVGADAAIALAYFSIPLAIVNFARRRDDFTFRGLAGLFSAFIFACGVTHVMGIWTIWQPDYGPHALTKIITAIVSVFTAVAVWRLIPQALRIPSVAHLTSVIQRLEAEVAKRRTAEDRLAETQQALAVALTSIGAGFIATDREGRITRLNSVAERVLGWPEAQALGQPLFDVYQRDNRPAAHLGRNPVELMIEAGVTAETAHHHTAVSRDGTRTVIEVKGSTTYGDDGQVRGMAMVFRDVSEQMRAEIAVNRLAAIVESSNDAIIGKTLDGQITSWNRAAETMFGYKPEEAIGQPIHLLIPPDRLDEEMRILADLAGGFVVPPFDTVRRARSGRLVQVSVSISPIRDARGRIVGASKIARDVSLQRAAEAGLRDSEERLRFTLDAAQIGDWSLDLDSGRSRRSLRHDRCFGYTAPVPEWTLDVFAAHLHPGDRPRVLQRIRSSIETACDYIDEFRVVWPDGSEHWLRAHGSVRQEQGRSRRMLGIVTDITQHKQAEQSRALSQRLEAENRQILEASRLKSQFLANMSHELRTPLNAVIGFADLLHSGAVPPASPKVREYLGHIGSSGRHLLQLINDVLDLSKVEAGKFEFFPERVSLVPLVQEVQNVLHTALQDKGIRIGVEIHPDVRELVLDPGRLKQALYNYLSNAIKFTPEGGSITVRALPEGASHWRLEVHDTGIGIDASQMPLLFTEFRQLDAGYGKQHQGTGLGLALTRRLVEAQGGSVGVRSTPGIGSVFHLVLRRVQGEDGEETASGRRLLVIEDDPEPQRRLSTALVGAGYAVDVADSASMAVDRARHHPYSGITLDLALPDRGGLAALADIRSHGPSRLSPVVSLSVPATPGETATFGVADVLFKPISTEELAFAVTRLRNSGVDASRMLVIDDDPLALTLMQATLTNIGISVVCMNDGRQAIEELDQHRPDVIVLDLMMPGFDGFAVLDALHRLPAWSHTPVFIWTSMLLTDAEMAVLSQSAVAIVAKGGGDVGALLESLRRRRLTGPVLVAEGGTA